MIIPLKKIAIGRVWSTFIVLKYSGLKTKQKTTFNIHTDEDMLLKAMEDVHCSSLMLPSDDRRGSSVLGVPPLQLHLLSLHEGHPAGAATVMQTWREQLCADEPEELCPADKSMLRCRQLAAADSTLFCICSLQLYSSPNSFSGGRLCRFTTLTPLFLHRNEQDRNEARLLATC